MATIRVDVRLSGPVFRTGYPKQVIKSYMDAATLKIAKAGKADVDATLRQVLKYPTGYYQSKIAIRRFVGAAVIYDQRVIYGWWLEGIGSRNYPVTSFHGYHTFRSAYARLEPKAGEIAEQVMAQYIRRLN